MINNVFAIGLFLMVLLVFFSFGKPMMSARKLKKNIENEWPNINVSLDGKVFTSEELELLEAQTGSEHGFNSPVFLNYVICEVQTRQHDKYILWLTSNFKGQIIHQFIEPLEDASERKRSDSGSTR